MASWQEKNKRLTRAFEFPDFAAAMAFVNKVAQAAEAANHHPDIFIRYNKVTLELWTHSAGRVTEKDHVLAKQINTLM